MSNRAGTTAEDPRTSLASTWVRLYTGEGAPPVFPTVAATPRGDPAARSVADAHAAWLRWHDPSAAFPFRQVSEAAYAAYVVAERARVEAVSARHLRGMARNLALQDALLPGPPALAQLYRDVRAVLDTRPREDVADLDAHRFAAQWRERILSAASAPREGGDPTAARVPHEEPRSSSTAQASAELESDTRLDAPSGESEGEHDDKASTAVQGPDGEPDDTDTELPPTASDQLERWFPAYRVYTRRWDQEIDAAALLQTPEGASDVDLSLREDSQLWRHAVEFKRRILAAHDWRWHFDRPEGQIDPRRLARLVAGRPPFEIFRVREFTGEMAAVTFLVDQSGSMKGEPQRLTVLTVDLATRVLESLGIPCEILGYTTRFGGSSRQSSTRNPVLDAWRAAGSPPAPGRLNAVRHIVIKRFNQPYHQARNNLRVLVAPALGRENIDGEALHWAARRLAGRPEPRKVLLVLSDATPLDPATQQANAPLFLEGHLRAVIAGIEHSPVRLGAIGIGTRLEAFYRRALTVPRPEDIDRLVFGFLGDLLK